jgi:hypothetical protein
VRDCGSPKYFERIGVSFGCVLWGYPIYLN